MEKSEVFNIIDEYMQTHQSVSIISQVQEFDLRERIVRVEEGLKHLGERFEQMIEMMEKRFELMEKRFEQIDKRFEQVEKRFEQIDKRFEQVDKRFDEQQAAINRLSNRMFQFMIWSFGFTASAAGVIIAVLK